DGRVAIQSEMGAQPRGGVAALRVVSDDHRFVADPEPTHRLRELLCSREHPARMPRWGRGSREVLGPARVDRSRQVSGDVARAHVLVEAKAAIDDAYARIADRGRDTLGRPEELRA